MNNWDLLVQNILSKWPVDTDFLTSSVGQHLIVLKQPNQLFELAFFLKDRGYKVLQSISATDFPAANAIEVSYFLATFSTDIIENDDIQIKVQVPREKTNLPSVVSLWPAANFLERECFDMLGVIFDGHPDLTRILTSEDWEGYPLRKDYVPAEMWRGIRINPVEKTNPEDREFSKVQKKDPQAQRPRW